MARERLVANVKGGQFGPRAIFFDLRPGGRRRGGGAGQIGELEPQKTEEEAQKKKAVEGLFEGRV